MRGLSTVARGTVSLLSGLTVLLALGYGVLLLAGYKPAAVYSVDYQARHGLASSSHVQRALATLVREEIAGRDEAGVYRIVEPFLAEWLNREMTESPTDGIPRGCGTCPSNAWTGARWW